jgi:hypothetical protein
MPGTRGVRRSAANFSFARRRGDHRGDDYHGTLEASLKAEQLESATRRARELQAVRRASLTETALIR